MKLTKREKLFAEKVAPGKTYTLEQALDLIKTCATAKFKESVDLAVNLGVDAKKSDQNVRGSTTLPHGNGKTVRVAVFAQGAKAQEAK
ncbi:50S ribosomal protein L1, partial [Acinetobacter baumannii]